MEKLSTIHSTVAPLDRANIDTDAIIPKQFLKSIKRSGFGVNLFDEWRYLDKGEPDSDNSNRPINPDFILNLPRYKGAKILITGENFGCGSSREHAPWALKDYGFDAIIAPSFADIFYNNCFKNAILPISLDVSTCNALMQAALSQDGLELTINLATQTIHNHEQHYQFDIDPFRKKCLLEGLDDIGITLQHTDAIKQFEQRKRQEHPWVFESLKL